MRDRGVAVSSAHGVRRTRVRLSAVPYFPKENWEHANERSEFAAVPLFTAGASSRATAVKMGPRTTSEASLPVVPYHLYSPPPRAPPAHSTGFAHGRRRRPFARPEGASLPRWSKNLDQKKPDARPPASRPVKRLATLGVCSSRRSVESVGSELANSDDERSESSGGPTPPFSSSGRGRAATAPQKRGRHEAFEY